MMEICKALVLRAFAVAPLAGAIAIIFLASALGSASPAKAEDDVERVFALFDTSGDGVIDRTEFDLNKIMVIVAFDKNRNDHLDRDEVKMSDENFQAADLDGDGKISGFEFVESPFGKFDAIDTDLDGFVSIEEFRAYVERLQN